MEKKRKNAVRRRWKTSLNGQREIKNNFVLSFVFSRLRALLVAAREGA